MSLILDALRKSERTRQQSLTGRLGSAETPTGPGRLPVPWVPLIAALLVANGVLLFFFWPRSPEPARAAETPVAEAPAPAPAYRPNVRPLADEADDDAAAAPVPPQNGPAVSPAVQPVPTQGALSPPIQTSAAGTASLPTFDALSPEQRQSLPALHMDVHGYAADPKDRFVVINLKQYHIGDVLDEGPTLKDILPQGAVLEFHGTTFLLPAY